MFQAVVESTLVHHTDFNPQGMARPLLLSAKIIDVVTNKGKWSPPWHLNDENEDVSPIIVYEEESDSYLKDNFAVINAGSEDAAFAATQDLMKRLVWVVVTRSLTEVPDAINEEAEADKENDANDGDSLDEDFGRDDDDSLNLCDDNEVEEHEDENEVENEDSAFCDEEEHLILSSR